MRAQTSGFKEVKLLVNKAVTKAHERLGRERAKAAGDDRALRMQALKANDMAAYQEMLRAQQGSAAAQDERCAPPSHPRSPPPGHTCVTRREKCDRRAGTPRSSRSSRRRRST